MTPYGKPTPGVPEGRPRIDAAREAFGLPPLAPATDPPAGPNEASLRRALAHLDHAQTYIDEARTLIQAALGVPPPAPYAHQSANKAAG